MDPPSELSLAEIRNYMLLNGCKVTNHALVKHFKRFLTNPDNQNEARKQFKTYVNTLATIKNENNEKFLILRKKYLNECPPEDSVSRSDAPMSPGAQSLISVGEGSPYRQPPPYKPPPEVTSPSSSHVKLPVLESGTKENYRDCISEFQAAVSKIDSNRLFSESSQPSTPEICQGDTGPPAVPPRKRTSIERSVSRETSLEENKENVAAVSSVSRSKNETDSIEKNSASDVENPISVKEATKKFNRMASEEEAKIIISPTSKKKPEKTIPEDKMSAEVTLAHPKSKEWIVSAAKANYQELAKLASDNPELVKLQDPTTGYTALHWAAKHGKEDVVKLIAGTYKADVNARTNGGYTPLHLAMQFGKDNIFELLCNTYKANRDLLDWSGNKPLDYRKQRTTVSASTYSSEYNLLNPETYARWEGVYNPPLSGASAGGTMTLLRRKRSTHKRNAQSGNELYRTQSLMFPASRKDPKKREGTAHLSMFGEPSKSGIDDSDTNNNPSLLRKDTKHGGSTENLQRKKYGSLHKKVKTASRKTVLGVPTNDSTV